MRIRLLDANDFDAVNDIDAEAYAEYLEYLKREHPDRYKNAKKTFTLQPAYLSHYQKARCSYVVEEDGAVQGYVLSQPIPHMHGLDLVLYIEYIVVRAKYRRRGFGTALLRKLLKAAKQKGVNRIYVDISSDNTPSIQLHQHVGFTVTDHKIGRLTMNHTQREHFDASLKPPQK